MQKQTEKKEISQGVCRFCQQTVAKGKMTQHLKACKARFASATHQDRREQRLLHVFVEGKYRPEYWMHLEVPGAATLADLDDFLRDTWLECCGHLSEFTIGEVSYTAYEDDWAMGAGGLTLVGDEEEEEEAVGEEEDMEEGEIPGMAEMADEVSKQLSLEFQADLKDVSVSDIEKKLEQLFAEKMPPSMASTTMPALRPLLNYMATALQQGVLAEALEGMEEEEEKGMDVELGDVLAVGEKFSYVYDFGSSSTLSLRVIAEREGVPPTVEELEEEEEEPEEEDLAIVVMARNNPPALKCHICGQPATHVPSLSEYTSLAEAALCEVHARESEYAEELLPIVNSPRTGICGYTGEEDEDWDDEEWDEDEDDMDE